MLPMERSDPVNTETIELYYLDELLETHPEDVKLMMRNITSVAFLR